MKLPHTDSVLVCVRARERCYLYLIVMPVFLEGLDPNIQCETMKHYQYPGQKHCAFWIIPSRPVPICVCVSHHNEKTAFVGPSGREQEPGYYCFMPDELKEKIKHLQNWVFMGTQYSERHGEDGFQLLDSPYFNP